MTAEANTILAKLTLRRVIAGVAFPPLLASAFQPFPTIYLTYPQRLVFWIGVMGLALCVTWIVRQVAQKYFVQAHFTWRDFALVLVILALFVPSVWLMSYLLFTVGGQRAPDVLAVIPYGALFATGLVLTHGHRQVNETDSPHIVRPSPRLTKRLPETFSGQIYRLTGRNHAIDVVTSEGTFTIRSRLTDAIAEMEPIPGHCTHRSHWVADYAITGVEKIEGKTYLRLANTDLVPVSRKYKPELEQDGII
ncbi:LytTr DNA-binding domain protein [Ruegeria denitrificans]|uniref:LytTr DNA-binding domain protein n=1 Tax=Ruegeria denitrificans TaxID=1715692 RepID=A0A0P1IT64_9RHOB|nr:LytTR family DNA-binding domain-containing protein [Ruegeria denitrificans]CUK04712.1 LytTr DNA-binding domain protein [Ruegeria denitrificans]